MLNEDDKWFAVTLRFTGSGFDPNEIESLLGIAPTSMRIAGEKWTGKNGKEYGPAIRNVWCHHIDAPCETGFDEQIRCFLTKFHGSKESIKVLAAKDGVEAELFCGFGSGNGQGGDLITPETLTCVGSLGVSLVLDLYPPDIDERFTDLYQET